MIKRTALPRPHLPHAETEGRFVDLRFGQDSVDWCKGTCLRRRRLRLFNQPEPLLTHSSGPRGDIHSIQHHLYGAVRVQETVTLLSPVDATPLRLLHAARFAQKFLLVLRVLVREQTLCTPLHGHSHPTLSAQ